MTHMSPQSRLENSKSGARSQAGKTGQAALGEFRDQGPAVPQHPPPQMFSTSEEATVWRFQVNSLPLACQRHSSPG